SVEIDVEGAVRGRLPEAEVARDSEVHANVLDRQQRDGVDDLPMDHSRARGPSRSRRDGEGYQQRDERERGEDSASQERETHSDPSSGSAARRRTSLESPRMAD